MANKVSQHRVQGGDVAALLALIVKRQKQAEARLGPHHLVSGRTSYKGLWPEDHSRAAERRLVRGVGPLVAVRLVERCRQTPFQPGPELVVSPAQLRAVEQRGHVLG